MLYDCLFIKINEPYTVLSNSVVRCLFGGGGALTRRGRLFNIFSLEGGANSKRGAI